MFYSHEVLTSRKHGVATIWLVATLGSKSSLKRINKKAILEVDIRGACDAVKNPTAPLALRLQSNLMFGISKIYDRQCQYVLVDTETMHACIRSMPNSKRSTNLDPQAGKAKLDQLVVQDDPAFLPDSFSQLDLDLIGLGAIEGLDLQPVVDSLTSSSHLAVPSSDFGLVISSSHSIEAGEFNVANSVQSPIHSLVPSPRDRLFDRHIIGSFDPDVGFEFDGEGNLLDTGAGPQQGPESAEHKNLQPMLPDESKDMRPEYEDINVARLSISSKELNSFANNSQYENAYEVGLDLVDLIPGHKQDQLPLREALQSHSTPTTQRASSHTLQAEAETAIATQGRRPRSQKQFKIDKQLQIRNTELQSWNDNYAPNMAASRNTNYQKTLGKLARIRAQRLVFGAGLNCVGDMPLVYKVSHPLSIFAGKGMQNLLAEPSRKRRHSPDTPERSAIRKQARPQNETKRRHNSLEQGIFEDDIEVARFDEDIEIGREQQQPLLDDHSSQMPWNIVASHYGSRQDSRQSSVIRVNIDLSSSAGVGRGQISSAMRGADVMSRGSRQSSRVLLSSPQLPQNYSSSTALRERSLLLGEDSMQQAVEPEDAGPTDFELLGPAVDVDTQTAAGRQWLRNTLSKESINFLHFIQTRIVEPDHGDEMVDVSSTVLHGNITFNKLLPTNVHSRTVAAQAFMHLLALSSQRLLTVGQKSDFGEITMTVIQGLETE